MSNELDIPTFKPEGLETSKTGAFQIMPLSEEEGGDRLEGEKPKDIGERDMLEDFQSQLEPDPVPAETVSDYPPQPKNAKDRQFVGTV